MADDSHSPIPVQHDEHENDTNKEQEIEESLRIVDELKQEGNDYFRAKQWDQALNVYRSALGRLPKRPSKKTKYDDLENTRLTEEDRGQDTAAASEIPSSSSEPEPEEIPEPSELEKQCSKARAVMNSNIGACYVMLDDHKQAVEACTEALLDDPDYIKALQRRATSNDKINTWSSLTSAQEDYTKLQSLLPSSSPQQAEIARSLRLLKPRLEAAQKKETAEMMNKLKGIGNSILGNFGMSTDNFKFVPNGQGGYSMNFTR